MHIYERYADSAAAVVHLEEFAKRFASRFMGMVERKRFTVFGYPSAELKAVLDGFNATYMKAFGDFVIGRKVQWNENKLPGVLSRSGNRKA